MMTGFMIDAARCVEEPAWYRRLIGFCAQWGIDTLLLHLTDDQGSALHLPRWPEFSAPHALDAAEWRVLVRCAAERGVTLIPEVEALGHTSFITRSPRFAHLSETPADPDARGFTGLCPLADESLALLSDLFREFAGVFPSPWFHIGCDEVNLGGHPKTRAALATTEAWELYGQHVARLHELVRGLGRRTLMWGDHLLSEPRLAERIPKDVVIVDWVYVPQPDPRHVAFPVAAGYATIAGPALTWYGGGFTRPGRANFDNIAEMSRRAREQRALGTITTAWVPVRYLPDTLWPGLAQAAALMRGDDPLAARDRFVREFWLSAPDDAWREGLQLAGDTAPAYEEFRLLYPLEPVDFAGLRSRLDGLEQRWADPLAQAEKLLARCRASVREHRESLDALLVAVRLQRHALCRAGRLRWCLEKPGRRFPASLAAQDAAFVRLLRRHWACARSPRHPLCRQAIPGLDLQQNLFARVGYAAALAQEWAARPETLARAAVPRP